MDVLFAVMTARARATNAATGSNAPLLGTSNASPFRLAGQLGK